MAFVVTGWKAGAAYRQEFPTLAGAQAYIDDAIEKEFFDVRATDEAGRTYSTAEIDAALSGDSPPAKQSESGDK